MTSAAQLDLLVLADSVDGGMGAAAGAHARWFAEQGWRTALGSVDASSADLAPAEAIEVPVPVSAFDVLDMWRAAAALRRVLADRRPRVVHAHGARTQLVALLAGRRTFVTLHGAGRLAEQGSVGTAARNFGRRVAPALASRGYSVNPAPGWETLLHASPRLSGIRPAPVTDAIEPVFLWVGRLDPPKRPDVFVEAVALAARRHPVRGRVVGDGVLREATERLARELEAPVDFLGARDDVAAQLSDARALCLFSDFEGVPFVVQEAMWAGRPVVLSDLPTLRWFAGDAARYVSGAADAARVLDDLTDLSTARSEGGRAAAAVRGLLSPEAPYPRLAADYGLTPTSSLAVCRTAVVRSCPSTQKNGTAPKGDSRITPNRAVTNSVPLTRTYVTDNWS